MARKTAVKAPASVADVSLVADAPTPGPAFVSDAGAMFQKDRSGDPRAQSDSEGKANFAAFSAQIQADHAPEPEEAA